LNNTIQFIEKNKIIVICRRVYGEDLMCLAKALHAGGIRLLEVTFDQANPGCIEKTAQAITMLTKSIGGGLLVGAGTALTKDQVKAAQEAGAKYIVSPNVDLEIIRYSKALGMASIPGALTPTEILSAHNAGADFVKLFPAGSMGMKYIKDILTPITHVKLIATGGVTEETLPEYLRLGFAGAGISGRLTESSLIAKKDYPELERRARSFMSIVWEANHSP